MRIYCKVLRLSACLFALLCLSSVGDASPPSSENNVHFCRVLDIEDMRERDSIYAATKQALDLNVGEPRTVRMIYFLPNDRPFRQEVVDSMKVTIRQVQTFFADQMEAHGYGRKTFRFETDAQDDPVVHRVDGQHPDSHYLDNTANTVYREIEQAFDMRENVYFIVIDNSTNWIGARSVRGVGGPEGKNGGSMLVDERFLWTTVAHELGHAFGLAHDFRDGAYIMSYGPGQNRLSMCHAEYLTVDSYFNPDTPTEEAQSPTIELISPAGYPPDSKSVSLQLKVSDLEGLHQVILFTAAEGFEVKACRGLAGKKNTIVEFEYDGVIPSIGYTTSLSNPAIHPSHIEAVDTDGNLGRASFKLWEASPQHIAILEGHTGGIHSVAFSPDGRILASGSQDSTVKLWDVSTGKNITTFGFTGFIRSIAFSPDGTILAIGYHREIKLWDVAMGKNIATFGLTDYIRSIAFSPDGTMLASGLYDNTVKLWDVATKKNSVTLEGHTGFIISVAFSPDGQTLASGSYDNTIMLWDVATGRHIATLEGHVGGVYSVAFSPDGTILASGSYNEVILWDVEKGENITTLEGHGGLVHSIAFSPDGATLASGSWDETIRLWDVTKKINIATFKSSGLVHSIAFSSNGKILASGSADSEIELWDVSEWQLPRPVTLVKISGDNQQSTPGTELANPFIVEVRDQYGNPLQGAQITLAITAGDGQLRGRFTVDHAITDANGRVERTLTPGPGTNTVEVSVAGIKETFNTVGVGMPTTSIIDGSSQTWHLPDGAMIRMGKGSISGSDKAVAFSPDGRSLAVASGIGVWLYDVATLRERALFIGHRGEVTSVSFSRNGATLASGSRDGTVKLWDVAVGEDIATFEGHRGEVTSVSFSPNGTILASGSNDHTVRLWDVATKENIAILEGHTGSVASVSFSRNGAILVSGSGDHTVKLWDVATKTNIATLEGHTSGVSSIAFSPDGMILGSGAGDGTARLWDIATRETIAIYKHVVQFFGVDKVNTITFSLDGTTLAVGTDNKVELWDVVTKTNIATLDRDISGIKSVSFSPVGTTLAIGSSRGTVKLWDIATQNVSTLAGYMSWVRSVAFSPNGTILASGSEGEVKLWDIETGRHVTTLDRYAGSVLSMVFSSEGTLLAAVSSEGINLWDILTGETIATLKHRSTVTSMVFSPDGMLLASGSGRNVLLWDVLTGETIATLEGHTSGVSSVAFSPDGTTLVSGSYDKTIKLWDVSKKENISTLSHDSWVGSVSFSPDGTLLASGSERNVMLWDVATRENIATLEGHWAGVPSVSFSPDGTILASGSYDRTIKLWDVVTGQNIATFEGHREGVYSVAFLPYGTTLASGSRDGTVLLWDVSQYVTPVVYMPDANLRAVIRDALGKSRFAPITTTNMASLTTLDASNRNIRDLTGLESATNLTELNLVDNRLSSLSINTHIPALQDRGVEVLFDKTPTPDFNGDGVVGFADFLQFVAQFGFSEDDAGYDAQFDLDGDGTIGFGDFLIFANAFGKVVSSN